MVEGGVLFGAVELLQRREIIVSRH